MPLLASIGESVKSKTQDRINSHEGEHSLWFPHGPLGFGGHYSPKQIKEFLQQIPLEELGAKGLKLRIIVGSAAMTILAGGGYIMK